MDSITTGLPEPTPEARKAQAFINAVLDMERPAMMYGPGLADTDAWAFSRQAARATRRPDLEAMPRRFSPYLPYGEILIIDRAKLARPFPPGSGFFTIPG